MLPAGWRLALGSTPYPPPGARSFIVTDDFLVQSFITG